MSGPTISTSNVLEADWKMGRCEAKAKRYPGMVKMRRPISRDFKAIFTSPFWPRASSGLMMAPPPLNRSENTRKLWSTSSICVIAFSKSSMNFMFCFTGIPATGSINMKTMLLLPKGR